MRLPKAIQIQLVYLTHVYPIVHKIKILLVI